MKNSFWKKVLLGGCAYFTASAILISLILLFANIGTAKSIFDIYFSAFRLALFAIFCFAFAFANTFYSSDKMRESFRMIAHFFITGLAFWACIYMPVSAEMEASGASLPPQNTAVMLALFTVVYFVIYGIYKLIMKLTKKTKDKKEAYTPVYKNFKK